MNTGFVMPTSEPKYALSEVARATGVPIDTLRTWLRRGQLPTGSADLATVISGAARKVSARTAIAVAIVKALSSDGAKPGATREAAFAAAVQFAHTDDGNRPGPGELFGGATTYLAVAGNGNIRITNNLLDLGDTAFAGEGGFVTFLAVDDLHQDVLKNLGEVLTY